MFEVTKNNKYGNGYEGLIESFGVEVVLDEHDDDYQGDSFYILRDAEDRYGFLAFGWGSCSGCDAFSSAWDSGDAALVELRDELWDDVEWHDSLDDLRVVFDEEDVQLKWYGHSKAFKNFLQGLKGL